MKRTFDVVGATMVLLVASPLLFVIAVLTALTQGRPVLFRQVRAGREGRPFVMRKFRTMHETRDEAGLLVPDEARLTWLGRYLRSTSLDELPELWNVVVGDMALVGPRPLPVRYLPRYTTSEARRHEVKPGITGWAQVNGRNLIEWDARLAMDTWYVDHQSLGLDLRILWRTVLVVLMREGIGATDTATMTELRPHMAIESDGS